MSNKRRGASEVGMAAIIFGCVAAAVAVAFAIAWYTQETAQTGSGIEVGQLAQEIEGEDIEGVRFKLSDYRGKVVVLDFWGNW